MPGAWSRDPGDQTLGAGRLRAGLAAMKKIRQAHPKGNISLLTTPPSRPGKASPISTRCSAMGLTDLLIAASASTKVASAESLITGSSRPRAGASGLSFRRIWACSTRS